VTDIPSPNELIELTKRLGIRLIKVDEVGQRAVCARLDVSSKIATFEEAAKVGWALRKAACATCQEPIVVSQFVNDDNVFICTVCYQQERAKA
jgi:formylmethanofuran dehydrogenase subunit E